MEKYYLNEDEYVDQGVPSITTFYDNEYPSIVDRYFTRFYYPKASASNENEDHIVLFHSNRLVLVGLAKSHVAFSKGIASISYDIGNYDRSQNHKALKGKHKKGGMNLQPTTALALINCNDGSTYKVDSTVTGKLIEVNDRLGANLEQLSIEGKGYIAVILCKPELCDKLKSNLVAEADYVPSH